MGASSSTPPPARVETHSSSVRVSPVVLQRMMEDRFDSPFFARVETHSSSEPSSLDMLHRMMEDRFDSPFFEAATSLVTRSSSFEFLPPNMSELRVILLGNNWSQRSSVGNFILGETKFSTEEEPHEVQRERGKFKDKEIVLINFPDLLPSSISRHRLMRFHARSCVRLSDPGPHVFLLVLQPEDFTEEHKVKLCRVLQCFSDRSFDHSLVLISTPREERPGFMEKFRQHPPLKDLIKQCRYRFLWQKDLEHPELLTRLGQVVKENNGEHVKLRTLEHFMFFI